MQRLGDVFMLNFCCNVFGFFFGIRSRKKKPQENIIINIRNNDKNVCLLALLWEYLFVVLL